MDISEFTVKLRRAICDLGISPKDADDYVLRLRKYLTPEDTENATDDEILESAEVCARLIRNQNSEETADIPADIDTQATAEYKISDITSADDTQATTEYKISDIASADDTIEVKINSTPVEDLSEVKDFEPAPSSQLYENEKASSRGVFMFSLITFLTSPLWLVAAAIFFLPFTVMIAAEAAATALFIALLAGGSAGGAAASLTGIIYGIVTLFSDTGAGIYEIGFGIILVGVTMIFSILSYNGAVRLMPWVFKKTGVLYRFTWSKVKPYLSAYKRRCEKL